MLKLFKAATLKAPAPVAPWDNFSPSDFLLVVKGAPEVLLPRCKFTLDPQGGEPIPLSQDVIERITGVQEAWARDGQRVLLLARRVVREDEISREADPLSEEYGELVEALREDLIIVGMVGLIDPLRPSIPEVVKTCRRAGIRFFIVTGKHRRDLFVARCAKRSLGCRGSSDNFSGHRFARRHRHRRQSYSPLRRPLFRQSRNPA